MLYAWRHCPMCIDNECWGCSTPHPDTAVVRAVLSPKATISVPPLVVAAIWLNLHPHILPVFCIWSHSESLVIALGPDTTTSHQLTQLHPEGNREQTHWESHKQSFKAQIRGKHLLPSWISMVYILYQQGKGTDFYVLKFFNSYFFSSVVFLRNNYIIISHTIISFFSSIHMCIQCLRHFSPLLFLLPLSLPGRNCSAFISNFVEERV
jgi:hypothetical protein